MRYKLRYFIISLCIFFSSIFIITYRYWPDTNYFEEIAYTQGVKTEISTIRAATFNIKSLGNGKAINTAMEEIIDLDADILVLQEVHKDAYRFDHLDMSELIKEKCNYNYARFYPSMWQGDGYYGLAILSKYPIKTITSLRLPNQLTQEPRILAHAAIDVEGKELQVYTTHVTYKDRTIRRKQIQRVIEEVQGQENTILLGDFNTFRETDLFDIAGMYAITTKDHKYITFRDFAYPDQIFYSTDLIKLNDGMYKTTFSDHHALYIDLQIITTS